MKPLFIPLKGEFYDAFERREKFYEYRVYGPRWNERTCIPGREVILSRGYGKSKRMMGIISSATIASPSDSFVRLFGHGKQCFAIQLVGLRDIEQLTKG